LAKLKLDIKKINNELIDLESTLDNIQKEFATNKKVSQLENRILEMVNIVGRVKDVSKELKAPIIFPTPEDLTVKLVPSHLLDQLEEYRTDETTVFLLIGVFFGAILGILVNWATNPQYHFTLISIELVNSSCMLEYLPLLLILA
jgi:hypothetical protein